MRYVAIIAIVSLFAIVAVWQNIEMRTEKLACVELARKEMYLSRVNDRFRFEIERHRRIERVSAFGAANGYGRLGPADITVLVVRKQDGK